MTHKEYGVTDITDILHIARLATHSTHGQDNRHGAQDHHQLSAPCHCTWLYMALLPIRQMINYRRSRLRSFELCIATAGIIQRLVPPPRSTRTGI